MQHSWVIWLSLISMNVTNLLNRRVGIEVLEICLLTEDVVTIIFSMQLSRSFAFERILNY